MHGEAPRRKTKNEPSLKKANDCIRDQKYYVCGQLFDAFWREGELGLLFGAPGTGKSILATQIAECIARGTGADGFGSRVTRRRVLYVDLKLSDGQHKMRYQRTFDNRPEKRSYQFSENLYRHAPPDVSKLAEWVRDEVTKNSIRVVVIDDLSAVKRSGDGLRETLPLMRDLKALARELEISILVVSGSREPGRGSVSEADLQRSQVLCDIADSTFALATHPRTPGARYLVQTRSVYERVWNYDNAPACYLERSDDGFIHFAFDQRFVPALDERLRREICEVKRRKDNGETLREIGKALGFSPTTASSRFKQWRPEFEPPDEPAADTNLSFFAAASAAEEEAEEWEECGLEKPVWMDEGDDADPGNDLVERTSRQVPATPGPRAQTTRSIFLALGYEVRLDDYGNELFVESENERGRPVIAYQFDAYRGKVDHSGRLTRWRYKGDGRSGDTVRGPVCWLDFDPKRKGIFHIARVYSSARSG